MHLIFDHDDTTAVVLDKVTRFEVRHGFGEPEYSIHAYVVGAEDSVYLGSLPTKEEAVAWIREFAKDDGAGYTRGLKP